jgi:hypothetical protein
MTGRYSGSGGSGVTDSSGIFMERPGAPILSY